MFLYNINVPLQQKVRGKMVIIGAVAGSKASQLHSKPSVPKTTALEAVGRSSFLPFLKSFLQLATLRIAGCVCVCDSGQKDLPVASATVISIAWPAPAAFQN